MMLYTRKQMEREIDRRLHEAFQRQAMESEINDLHKRINAMEMRIRELEYKDCPGNVPANTEPVR